MEVWKDIKEYEGLYQVSNFGNIRSLPRRGTSKNVHIMFQKYNKCGYKMVGLYKDGKVKNRTVHRIVAETFLDNPLNKEDVNHIDGNKENNNVSNLEWTTHKENMKHARKNNLIRITNKVIEQGKNVGQKYGKINGLKRAKRILQISYYNESIKEWDSITQASKCTGISLSGISKCCNKKKNMAGGYKWEFVKQ